MTPNDADANLLGLASLVRALENEDRTTRTPIDVHFEGNSFAREEERIRTALHGLF